eukprot:5143028-Karenia_brevis.AAC.1
MMMMMMTAMMMIMTMMMMTMMMMNRVFMCSKSVCPERVFVPNIPELHCQCHALGEQHVAHPGYGAC